MAAPDVGGPASPTIAEILTKLGTDPKTGLNPSELQERQSNYGANALPEEKRAFGLRRLFLGTYPMDDRGCSAATTTGLSC